MLGLVNDGESKGTRHAAALSKDKCAHRSRLSQDRHIVSLSFIKTRRRQRLCAYRGGGRAPLLYKATGHTPDSKTRPGGNRETRRRTMQHANKRRGRAKAKDGKRKGGLWKAKKAADQKEGVLAQWFFAVYQPCVFSQRRPNGPAVSTDAVGVKMKMGKQAKPLAPRNGDGLARQHKPQMFARVSGRPERQSAPRCRSLVVCAPLTLVVSSRQYTRLNPKSFPSFFFIYLILFFP